MLEAEGIENVRNYKVDDEDGQDEGAPRSRKNKAE